VTANHSLHGTKRKLELREIDRRNGILMKMIEKPNNTVRNKDMQKHWLINQEFKNMISKNNRLTHEQYYTSISK
jgi:hypothetical protein